MSNSYPSDNTRKLILLAWSNKKLIYDKVNEEVSYDPEYDETTCMEY